MFCLFWRNQPCYLPEYPKIYALDYSIVGYRNDVELVYFSSLQRLKLEPVDELKSFFSEKLGAHIYYFF